MTNYDDLPKAGMKDELYSVIVLVAIVAVVSGCSMFFGDFDKHTLIDRELVTDIYAWSLSLALTLVLLVQTIYTTNRYWDLIPWMLYLIGWFVITSASILRVLDVHESQIFANSTAFVIAPLVATAGMLSWVIIRIFMPYKDENEVGPE